MGAAAPVCDAEAVMRRSWRAHDDPNIDILKLMARDITPSSLQPTQPTPSPAAAQAARYSCSRRSLDQTQPNSDSYGCRGPRVCDRQPYR
jgi:hypothetical protein